MTITPESVRNQLLYVQAVEGLANQVCGNTEAPSGWAALIHNTEGRRDAIAKALHITNTDTLDSMTGSFIVRLFVPFGPVTVESYDHYSDAAANFRWIATSFDSWEATED